LIGAIGAIEFDRIDTFALLPLPLRGGGRGGEAAVRLCCGEASIFNFFYYLCIRNGIQSSMKNDETK
jgi:hypothetical protein